MTTANPNWYWAESPLDLIPPTEDINGNGQRFMDLVGNFVLTQGPLAGKPFSLAILPWQEAFIRKVWGDVNPDGTRKIAEAALKIGKGSGKTTLLAAICIASLVDWEVREMNYGNQIIFISANVASADLAFRHVREAVAIDPWLRERFHSNLSRREMTYKPTGAMIKVIAPDLENAIGLRPALILADELHQAAVVNKDFASVIDQLRRGSQNTTEPLFIGVTTAAVARPEGYYREWLTRLRAIRDGALVNDTILPVLFEFPDSKLRPDLDISMTEEWWRAMPSMRTRSNPRGTMDIEALERELKEAADDADLNGPGQMELLLSQRLGLEAAERGGGSGQTPLARYWSANVEGATIPGHDVMLFVGMDPSAGLSDPFAVVTVWKDGSIYRCLSRQFLTKKAESEASKSTRKVYADATAAGELTTHDTTEELEAAVIAYSHRLNDHPGGVTFCGDAAGLAGFKSRFEGEVASYTPVPQGWQLLQSLELAGGLAHDDNLRHTGQPLLAANIENLVLENGRMRKYDAGSNGVGHAKIDGAMALLSALLQASTGRNFDPGALIG